MRLAIIMLFLFSAHMVSAQQPTPSTCAGITETDPPDPGLKTSAVLHPSKSPVTVEVHFLQTYANSQGTYRTDSWQEPQRNAICAAARHLQQIWSSAEFEQALNRPAVMMTLDGDKHGHVTATISGDKLYAKLISKPIVLTVAVTSKRSIVRNCGVSDSSSDQTALQSHYIADLQHRCGEPPLIPALTNTLAHEYTHYAVVDSTDNGKNANDNVSYVSYGIGCLTQMIGFPQNTCQYEGAETLRPKP